MQTRSLVVAIALVLALAVAAPTIGATTNRGVIAENALDIAKDARQLAKSAKRTANRARGVADSALNIANGANAAANTASTKADNAQSAANDASNKADAANAAANTASGKADAVAADLAGMKAKSASASGTVTTTTETSYQDLGGPSVTVTVPASGLIEVWAQASIVDGAASLYEDGHQVPDQDPNDICGDPGGSPPTDPLIAVIGGPPGTPFTTATPGTFSPAGCGSTSAPGPVLFSTTAGQHTYTLRYASCGCNAPDPAEFSDRFLAVAPKP